MKQSLSGLIFLCGCLACLAAPAETELFGAPDWRPPASWALPKVCGKDFWTILSYPRSPIYDEYAPFAPGNEPLKQAIFRETGDWLDLGLCNTYLERHAKEPRVPCYGGGTRYAPGMHFLPSELEGLSEAAVRLRKNKENAEPEYTIDGKLETGWAFPKLLPQWLMCTFPAKTTIDRIRFVPGASGKAIWQFFMEVSADGEAWIMVADKRQNLESITNAAGMELKFNPLEAKCVRLTITFLDDANSAVMELEAFRGAAKVPFASAAASASIYDGIFMSWKDKKALAKKLGPCFLGFATDEWGNDLGHLQAYWDGNTNLFETARNALVLSGRNAGDLSKYIPKKPDSAAQHLAFLQNEYRRLKTMADDQFFILESISEYIPYEAEWGKSILAEEFHLAGPSSYSMGWDLLRGAARQQGRPIMAYLTSYNGAYIGGVRQQKTLKHPIPEGHTMAWEDHTPHNGVSLSFEKRWLWFNYLSGANLLDFREDAYFYDRDTNNVQQLSPIGKVKAEWYEKVRQHPDRGVRATPIAIAFDYTYLLTRNLKFTQGGPDADEMKAMNAIMWAGSFYDGVLRKEQVDYRFIAVDKTRQSSFRPEHAGLRNRAIGEVFDWIMLNAPSGSGETALQNYRAVYLLGRFDATPALTAALRSFLGLGGIVVAQAAQLPLIPEEFRAIKVQSYIEDSEDIHDEFTGRDYVMAPYQGPVLKDNVKGAYRLALTEATQPVRKVYRDKVNRPVVLWSQAGKGGIFWVLGDFAQAHNFFPIQNDLLKQIGDHALPVKVAGDIQWLANKTEDGWVIGLLNNHGVYPKDPYQEADIDPRDDKQVTIEYPGRMSGVQEWVAGDKIVVQRDGSQSFVTITIPAGDIRIVQFRAR